MPEDNVTAAKQILTDPTGALLRMGVEDPKLLGQAPAIVNNHKKYLKSLQDMTVQPTLEKADDVDEEEAPPPLL